MDTNLSIYSFFPETFLWRYTLDLAIGNIAEKHKYTYKTLLYNSKPRLFFEQLDVDENCHLAFFEDNPEYDENDLHLIKNKLPNAKIIVFGTDNLYYNTTG